MTNRKNKVLSPHLSIYKPQITSITSILHRITGGFLFLSYIIIMWVVIDSLLTGMTYEFSYVPYIIKIGFLFAMSFSTIYHMLNGIRHLNFDMERRFDLPYIFQGGRFVLIMSFVISILLMTLVII